MRHVFIVGSKGIPARYGGFETFVDCLTGQKESNEIAYHVACMRQEEDRKEFLYHGARCFTIKVPSIGPAKAIYYDVAAIRECVRYMKKEADTGQRSLYFGMSNWSFYASLPKKLQSLGCTVFVNPDGHEWMRAKWSAPVKKYWKTSERLMVKYCDGLICDSVNIEKYIQREYAKYKPKTCFVAYGANVDETKQQESAVQKYQKWLEEHGLKQDEYYLIVGRFVPENNYATVIKEFLKTESDKKLVLVTNVEQNKYYQELCETTGCDEDDRICFPGTVYDAELLWIIRKHAYAYVHGHEVGGTNPSLLEALAVTDVNLLLDVSFNKEVGSDAALYWSKEEGSLQNVFEKLENISKAERTVLGEKARKRISEEYSWKKIVNQYEKIFLDRSW